MDYNKGYSASIYGRYVDPVTWRDLERFEIRDGSISLSNDELRATASFGIDEFPRNEEKWIRIYMDAKQGSTSEHIPLFTGLASSTVDNILGTFFENSIDCYSSLKPAQDTLLDRGWYAPGGIPAAELIIQLLECVPAPIEAADNSPSLSEAIIAEDNESCLTMIEKILTAIGWRMRVTGRGVVQIVPITTESSITLSALEYDVIEPEVEASRDWFSCPNVLRVTSGELTAIARDDSEDSWLSTVNRGREIWAEESDSQLNAGETVAEYAQRRLKELQSIQTVIKYNRRFIPELYPSDVVTLHYPQVGIQGSFEITSQSIDLTNRGAIQEEVKSL